MATDFDAKYGAPVKPPGGAGSINYDDKYGPAIAAPTADAPIDDGSAVALASVPRPASLRIAGGVAPGQPQLTKNSKGVLVGKPAPLVQPEDTDPRAALGTAIGAKVASDVPNFLKSAVTPALVPLAGQLGDESERFATALKTGTDPGAAKSVPDFLGKAAKTAAGAVGIDTSKLAEAARNKDIPSMISEGAVPLAENYALGKAAGLKNGIEAPELAAENASLARRALRPRDANLQFAKSTERAAPAIQEELAQREAPPASLEDWNDVFKTVKNRVWSQYKQLLDQTKGAPAPSVIDQMKGGTPVSQIENQGKPVTPNEYVIDGNKIADAITSSIDKRSALKNPTTAKAISDFADTYRRPLAPHEAEQFLEYANRESKPYFDLASRDPHQAPWMQANVAEGNALRKELNGTLDKIDPGAASQLKQTYGSLSSLHDYLQKRLPVVERQNSVNLQQSINRPFAAATYAAGHPLSGALQFILSEAQKRANDPVNQLNQAFMPRGPGLVNGTIMPGAIGAAARQQPGSPVGSLDKLKKAAQSVTQ